jgi:hypothetical protein
VQHLAHIGYMASEPVKALAEFVFRFDLSGAAAGAARTCDPGPLRSY